MALKNEARNVLQCTVLGNDLPVDVSIENTFKATIDFSLFNIPYTFTILSWSRRGLAKYLNLFHEFVQRNVAQ